MIRPPRAHSGSTRLALVVLLAAGLSGCRIGGDGKSLSQHNDLLRAEVQKLEAQVKALDARLENLTNKLEIEKKRQGVSLPAGVYRPTCVGIELSAYSGGVDTTKDGTDDLVRLYIDPQDEQGRLVLTVGTLAATLTHTPKGKAPVVVATLKMDAKAFDASYRSTFLGTHYTVEIKIPEGAVPAGTKTLTAKVELKDLLTGHTHKTERPVPWHEKRVAKPAPKTAG